MTSNKPLQIYCEGVKADFPQLATVIDNILKLAARPAPEPEHADDLAVDRFAAAMKEKLAKKRAEGRGGWEDKDYCGNSFLSRLLREHVTKGDPLDVGNLAMMLHQRGERIAAPEPGRHAGLIAQLREISERFSGCIGVSACCLPAANALAAETRRADEAEQKLAAAPGEYAGLVEEARVLADWQNVRKAHPVAIADTCADLASAIATLSAKLAAAEARLSYEDEGGGWPKMLGAEAALSSPRTGRRGMSDLISRLRLRAPVSHDREYLEAAANALEAAEAREAKLREALEKIASWGAYVGPQRVAEAALASSPAPAQTAKQEPDDPTYLDDWHEDPDMGAR